MRLAWEGCWNVAVLVSADGDFVPAVEQLQQRGLAVVHAGFSPNRSALATIQKELLSLAIRG
jgi:uncharacterized LabA/DUF88 family protein